MKQGIRVMWFLEKGCVGGWMPQRHYPIRDEALSDLKDQRGYDPKGWYRVRKWVRKVGV
jgi:hypothetical protein